MSGYLYHIRAPLVERWAHRELNLPKVVDRQGYLERGEAGRLAVAAAAAAGRLPAVLRDDDDETYAAYLRRVAPRWGVAAELVRARAEDLPRAARARRVAPLDGGDGALSVCLDDLMDRASAAAVWARVLRHLGLPGGGEGALDDDLLLVLVRLSSDPEQRGAHSSSSSSSAHRDAKESDRASLRANVTAAGGDALRRLEDEIGCARPGKRPLPAADPASSAADPTSTSSVARNTPRGTLSHRPCVACF